MSTMDDNLHTPDEPADGGPAFSAIGVGPRDDVYHQVGMSLRDVYALVTVPTLMAELYRVHAGNPLPEGGPTVYDIASQAAYEMADTMLKARSKAST